MLGSPVLDPLDARGLGAAARCACSSGCPTWECAGCSTADCLTGTCREQPPSAGWPRRCAVPALAIYSREDGVVGWRSCQDPAAEWVEVRSSHTGMGTDPEVYQAVADRLRHWSVPGPGWPDRGDPGRPLGHRVSSSTNPSASRPSAQPAASA